MKNLETLLKDYGISVIRDADFYLELSEKYNLPVSEIRFIDLNRTGVYLPNKEVRVGFRARVLTHLNTSQPRTTYFAAPVRGLSDTEFCVINKELRFKEQVLGYVEKVELDTCDVSYMRGPTKLNLNSRSRGECGGCRACVHNYKDLYDETVLKDNRPLVTQEQISAFFDDLEKRGVDISSLEQIAVVTGLFHGENNVITHLEIIKKVTAPRGFSGELLYFGSEVNSRKALEKMRELGNVALVYSVDNFTKRDKILHKIKAEIDLNKARETLFLAKELGVQTTYAYIDGIDNIDIIEKEARKFMECITRFPIINIYQVQTPGQIEIMDTYAKFLSYYLESRIIFEELFKNSGMRSRRWENYRPLWYDFFNGETLKE
ncbi:MAG: hypothetical protein NTZ02_00445 [Candidatus Woesearchaeota archaeon]|nr:hypothetical protein [Candidatus Woesearchaeota archaeon]